MRLIARRIIIVLLVAIVTACIGALILAPGNVYAQSGPNRFLTQTPHAGGVVCGQLSETVDGVTSFPSGTCFQNVTSMVIETSQAYHITDMVYWQYQNGFYVTSVSFNACVDAACSNGVVGLGTYTVGQSSNTIHLSSYSGNYFFYQVVWDMNTCQGCPNGVYVITEWEGYGTAGPTDTPTSTGTMTSTPTRTPTITNTPTVTRTPTITSTPTNTPLFVMGACGNPGQPPCHVYWQTPGPVYLLPTPVQITGTVNITGHVQIDNWPTPYRGELLPTQEANLLGGVIAQGGGTQGGTRDLFLSGYHWVTAIDYNMGCPIPIPPMGATLCFDYTEIQAVNLGPVQFPLTIIGAVALFAIAIKQFLKG